MWTETSLPFSGKLGSNISNFIYYARTASRAPVNAICAATFHPPNLTRRTTFTSRADGSPPLRTLDGVPCGKLLSVYFSVVKKGPSGKICSLWSPWLIRGRVLFQPVLL